MKVLIDKSHIVTCNVCQSVLQFDDKDVSETKDYEWNERSHSVNCLVCRNEIDITARMRK